MVIPDRLVELNSREREVLALLAEGWSNYYIMQKLFIEEGTMRWHMISIYRKLGLTGNKFKAMHPRVAAALIFYTNPQAIMDAFPKSFETDQWEMGDD